MTEHFELERFVRLEPGGSIISGKLGLLGRESQNKILNCLGPTFWTGNVNVRKTLALLETILNLSYCEQQLKHILTYSIFLNSCNV